MKLIYFRFMERDILIWGGVVGTMVCRLFLFPLPGGDHPLTKPDSELPQQSSFSQLMALSEESPSFRNVDCATSNGGESYCAHEWCDSLPALALWEYLIGVCLVSITNAFNQGLVQGVFSKILGPIPQARTKEYKLIETIHDTFKQAYFY